MNDRIDRIQLFGLFAGSRSIITIDDQESFATIVQDVFHGLWFKRRWYARTNKFFIGQDIGDAIHFLDLFTNLLYIACFDRIIHQYEMGRCHIKVFFQLIGTNDRFKGLWHIGNQIIVRLRMSLRIDHRRKGKEENR